MSTHVKPNACDVMARAIIFIKQEIKAKELRIKILTERLQKLQSQPNPDPTQIREIKTDIQDLEDQLENDRSQLNAFEEEFAASCGP